jgi:cytochrome b
MKRSDEIKVWDPLVRIFHWSLVASVISAYLSVNAWFAMHIWSGYAVTGLVAFRLVWGFVGTEHARFRDFVFSPATVIAYLKEMLSMHPTRFIGHSPASGAMVVALLISLVAIMLSGMTLYAVAEHSGPFASLELGIIGAISTSKYFWRDLHGFFVNFTLLLAFVHIGSVVVSSFAHGENLPRAMITGKKRKEL